MIERFWRVMDGFGDGEQAAVIAFAWGRSRLPAASSLGTVRLRDTIISLLRLLRLSITLDACPSQPLSPAVY